MLGCIGPLAAGLLVPVQGRLGSTCKGDELPCGLLCFNGILSNFGTDPAMSSLKHDLIKRRLCGLVLVCNFEE